MIRTETYVAEERHPITGVLMAEYLIERKIRNGHAVQETVRDENGRAVSPAKARELLAGVAA